MSNIGIAILGGLTAMLGYGISDFIAKKTIDKIGSLETLFYTQLFGSFFLMIYLFIDKSLPIFSVSNILSVTLFGLFNLIGFMALYKAFEVGKMSIVSPISASYSVLAAIISFLFFGETFSILKVIALFFVISGVLLTVFNFKEFKNGYSLKDLSKGVPEAFIVFLVFGFFNPLWDKFLSAQGWIVWVIAIKIIPVLALFIFSSVRKYKTKTKNHAIWALLFLVAIFEAAAAFGNSWGLHTSLNTTSIVVALTSTYPIVTIFFAYSFLKERLETSQYLGIAMILLGTIILPFS